MTPALCPAQVLRNPHMEKILYTAVATSTGGRAGNVATSDGVVKHDMAPPGAALPPGSTKTNPEQLFACGYAACFGGALEHVARLKKVTVSSVQITATVQLGVNADGSFQLAAKLAVKVGGVDAATAKQLADEAHQVCPYSRATRNNMPVEIAVEA